MRELRHLLVELWRIAKALRHEGWRRAAAKLLGLAYYYLYKAELAVRNRRAVQCTYCGWQGNRFFAVFDHVTRTRKDAACPRCGSNDRYRLYLAYLQRCTDFFNSDWRMLDIAAPRYFSKVARRNGRLRYFPADIKPGNVTVRLDLTALGIASDSLDFFIASHVIEHIEDEQAALREVYRVLKPGASAILQVPMDLNMEKTIEFGRPNPNEYQHYRRYGLDYKSRLEAAGFQVEVSMFYQTLPEDDILRFGIKREPLYIAHKPRSEAIR